MTLRVLFYYDDSYDISTVTTDGAVFELKRQIHFPGKAHWSREGDYHGLLSCNFGLERKTHLFEPAELASVLERIRALL